MTVRTVHAVPPVVGVLSMRTSYDSNDVDDDDATAIITVPPAPVAVVWSSMSRTSSSNTTTEASKTLTVETSSYSSEEANDETSPIASDAQLTNNGFVIPAVVSNKEETAGIIVTSSPLQQVDEEIETLDDAILYFFSALEIGTENVIESVVPSSCACTKDEEVGEE